MREREREREREIQKEARGLVEESSHAAQVIGRGVAFAGYVDGRRLAVVQRRDADGTEARRLAAGAGRRQTGPGGRHGVVAAFGRGRYVETGPGALPRHRQHGDQQNLQHPNGKKNKNKTKQTRQNVNTETTNSDRNTYKLA